MTPRVPVVLFDLDDTLMDHRGAVERAIAAHSRALGYPIGDDDGELWHALEERHYHAYLAGDATFEQQRRARARDFAAAHGRTLGDDESGRWFAAYFEHYREAWRLHPEVHAALDALRATLPGVRLGVITNGEADFQQRKLDRLGIAAEFDHVIASGALGVTKPDAAIFRAAVDAFAQDARDGGRALGGIAYVGDRLGTDALGAARAGLLGIWLDRPGRRPEPAASDGRSTPAEAAAERAAADAAGVVRIEGLDELAPLLGERLAERPA